jgi:TubC N-terminal docking domain
VNAVADILAEMSSRGVTVRADGEILRLKPRASLDDNLLARVQAHKHEILAALSGRPTTCVSSCYEIGPGKWIHHPWDGCKTPVPSREPYIPSRADCGCDGPVCSRCFLCPEHCHCRLRQAGPGVNLDPEAAAHE